MGGAMIIFYLLAMDPRDGLLADQLAITSCMTFTGQAIKLNKLIIYISISLSSMGGHMYVWAVPVAYGLCMLYDPQRVVHRYVLVALSFLS